MAPNRHAVLTKESDCMAKPPASSPQQMTQVPATHLLLRAELVLRCCRGRRAVGLWRQLVPPAARPVLPPPRPPLRLHNCNNVGQSANVCAVFMLHLADAPDTVMRTGGPVWAQCCSSHLCGVAVCQCELLCRLPPNLHGRRLDAFRFQRQRRLLRPRTSSCFPPPRQQQHLRACQCSHVSARVDA
jgi:hypothetical protein